MCPGFVLCLQIQLLCWRLYNLPLASSLISLGRRDAFKDSLGTQAAKVTLGCIRAGKRVEAVALPTSVQRLCVMKSAWQPYSSSHIYTLQLCAHWTVSELEYPETLFHRRIGQQNGLAIVIKNEWRNHSVFVVYFQSWSRYFLMSPDFVLCFLIQLLCCRLYNLPLTSSLISPAAPLDHKKIMVWSPNCPGSQRWLCKRWFSVDKTTDKLQGEKKTTSLFL